ncbi:MAG: 4-(cytidine 5'-diphospho)-2-C-methyl-D-erythritol kinase [Armatimonadetes bacterium]|nr:4-(cytidine 5'-diphospho)-2-C-methyl-D-erythritol kinase [Armatimonadota bacterium]
MTETVPFAGPSSKRPGRITVLAPAKINLFLEVLRRREDGYHDLQTIFQSIDLHDVLTLQVTEGGVRFACNVQELVNESNLCLKAVKLLQSSQLAGTNHGVSIDLEKRIPWGAGLGGGSSNAAATLRALNYLWNLDLGETTLHDLARRLGADVPFFLLGGCALGEGTGESLRSVKTRNNYWILLVKPPFEVETAQAYKQLSLSSRGASQSPRPLLAALEEGSIAEGGRLLYNRLESSVMEFRPELRDIKTMLLEAGARSSLMSGSGSCVYGLFQDPASAERARSLLSEQNLGELILARPTEGICPLTPSEMR